MLMCHRMYCRELLPAIYANCMIRQTFHFPPPSRPLLSALCGLWFGCYLASASASGLSADSADPLEWNDSLSHALFSTPLDLPGGQALSEHDLAHLIAAQEAPASQQMPANVNERVQSVLAQALAQIGIRYRWGGTAPSTGFDCSGLVKYVFQTALGIELPRVSREQAQRGQPVDRQELTPGDLVFFSRRGKVINHVGIYLGDGRFVHAPRTGRDVTISNLSGYWYQRFLRARRVPALHD